MIKNKILLLSIITFLSLGFFTENVNAAGKKIFINGKDLTQFLLANVTLKCVTVKFDKKGNIHIVAPAYDFKAVGKPKTITKPVVDKMAKRFYLVTFPTPAKFDIGYDVDLLINGKLAKRLYSKSSQQIIDVTKYMNKAKNTVIFVSKRKKGFKSKIKSGSVKYAIAKGYEKKGTYVIRNILWQIKRTLSDTKKSFYEKKSIKK
jgi:hypothetical protein